MTAVTLTRHGAAARIALDRPDAGNAIDPTLAEELAAAADAVSSDPSVRCVTLTGSGRLFCAGGDVGAMAAAGGNAAAFLYALASSLHGAIVTLATMEKPLLVAVNGPAAGAGLSLALLGDVVLAGRSAHFTAAYTGIGLTPDGGMSWLLPRIVGLRRAQSMILTNERVSAEEAARLGLVTRVVDDHELADEALKVANALVAAPTAAIGAARGLLLQGATSSLAEHLDREADTIAAAGTHPESREGLSAFLARRRPDFQGA
ncbi:enoyl-CoA hydratase-related protein [Sphingomonas sp. KR1UV-12]|uniref:Enoyl-CoA hydratase-related protein n=1 Tax=Sphingomonas aurea TaxID=3063994 RepID=A0ABT9EIX2_9SPHN|nr:enoyl-CoA hydratase-related protein [Sphingomonas sp. KR1UV-12]MDP1026869.1 enoyl-CoA hydratase-related protein [Sphingomonas sp. KR1UV-12]